MFTYVYEWQLGRITLTGVIVVENTAVGKQLMSEKGGLGSSTSQLSAIVLILHE
jgi:hypothetical protein